jgi:DNA (cytosine-5)-methyltransferase 1
MDDDRNWLFRQFKQALQELKPTAFVFENVSGLLNINGGQVFEMVREELLKETKSLSAWKLKAEEHGIPQRRTRVILVGSSLPVSPPPRITQHGAQGMMFDTLAPSVTVKDALADLPGLLPGEDGSTKDYVCEPLHPYQRFSRGLISAKQYLNSIGSARYRAQSA